MEKLEYKRWDEPNDGVSEIGYSQEGEIRELLLGRRVVEVDGDHLQLDNGTIVRVIPNGGGCSCGAGDYELEHLSLVDNAITKVEFELVNLPGFDKYDTDKYAYRIFVFADNKRINLLSVEGDDGNGYYGTGYELLVKPVAVEAVDGAR